MSIQHLFNSLLVAVAFLAATRIQIKSEDPDQNGE